MKLNELRAIVRKITYKPGHTIDLQAQFGGEVLLLLSFPVMDAHTGKMTKVGTKKMLAEKLWQRMTKDEALCWIFDEVVGLERHEVCEWLRYDKQPVVEPHPEEKREQRLSSFIKSLKSFWPVRHL